MSITTSREYTRFVKTAIGSGANVKAVTDAAYPISLRGWSMTRMTVEDARGIAAALTEACDWIERGAPDVMGV